MDPDRPELHDCMSRFNVALSSATLEPGTPVSQVLEKASKDVRIYIVSSTYTYIYEAN